MGWTTSQIGCGTRWTIHSGAVISSGRRDRPGQQRAQVEHECHQAGPDRGPDVPHAVADRDRVDVGVHGRGPGPQREDEADRDDPAVAMLQHVGQHRFEHVVDGLRGEEVPGRVQDLLLDLDLDARAEQRGQVADRPDQHQQQRGDRQQRPEPGLGGQTEDPVRPRLRHRGLRHRPDVRHRVPGPGPGVVAMLPQRVPQRYPGGVVLRGRGARPARFGDRAGRRRAAVSGHRRLPERRYQPPGAAWRPQWLVSGLTQRPSLDPRRNGGSLVRSLRHGRPCQLLSGFLILNCLINVA